MTEPTDRRPVPADREINAWAIISLLGILVPIVGIVAGHIALVQTRAGRAVGRELAIAGLVIGYAGVVMTVVTVLLLWSMLPVLGMFLEDLPPE